MPKQENVRKSIFGSLTNWANEPCDKNSFLLHTLHSLVRVLLITFKEFGKNELNIRASALTYTILLSLIPMLAMSTAVVKGLGGGNELKRVVYTYIDTLEETTPLTHFGLPTSAKPFPETNDTEEIITDPQNGLAITDQFRSVADQIFNYVDKTDFATLGTIGVLGVLLSAILVLSNIELSMNTIWHVSRGRSLLRKVTDYLTFLILMPLSINFGFAANAVLKNDVLLSKFNFLLQGPKMQTALLLLVPLFFITLTLFLIYIFFPNTKVKPFAALIGALIAGTLWFITQNIYIGLQIGVSKYNAIYGSFATLPLFLIWMFFSWVFILAGAQIAFACQRQKSYQLKSITHSPLEQLSAAIDILKATYSTYEDKVNFDKQQLPYHCPEYSAELLCSSLQRLIVAEIIAVTKNGRLLPGCPPGKLKYQRIVSAILGNSVPDTDGGRTSQALIKQAAPILNKSFFAEERYGKRVLQADKKNS